MTINVTEFPNFAMQEGNSLPILSGIPIGSAVGLAASDTYTCKNSMNKTSVIISAIGAAHTLTFGNSNVLSLASGQVITLQLPKDTIITIAS